MSGRGSSPAESPSPVSKLSPKARSRAEALLADSSWVGRQGSAVRIPEYFGIARSRQTPDEFLVEASPEADPFSSNLSISVRPGNYTPSYEPTIVLDQRPSVIAKGDAIVVPGGALDRVQLGGLDFWRIVSRDERRRSFSLTMIAYLDGYRISIDGRGSNAEDDDLWALLLLIGETFSRNAPAATVPDPREFNPVAAFQADGNRIESPAVRPVRSPVTITTEVPDVRVPQGSAGRAVAQPAATSLKRTATTSTERTSHPLLSNSTIKIPLGNGHQQVAYSEKNSDFALVNSTIYRLEDSAPIRHFPELKFNDASLSPAAKWLAVTSRSADGERILVIHSVQDGTAEPVQVVIDGENQYYNSVRFLSDEELLIGVRRPKSQFVVWDVEGRKISQSFECSADTFAVSHDSAYLAAAEFRAVNVYDLVKGRIVATMNLNAKSGMIRPSDIVGLAFTSDVTELAAVTPSHLLVWSQRGEIAAEGPAPAIKGLRRDHPWMLMSLPDDKGWLIAGRTVVLRDPLQMAFEVLTPRIFDDLPGVVVDRNRIIFPMGTFPREQFLADVAIPWTDVDKAVETRKKHGVLLGPGGQLAVKLTIGPRRLGSESEAREKIMNHFSFLASQSDVTIESGGKVILEAELSETPAQITGRTRDGVREGTQLLLELRLRNIETSQVIWEDKMQYLHGARTATEIDPDFPPLPTLFDRNRNVTIPMLVLGDGSVPLPVRLDLDGLFNR